MNAGLIQQRREQTTLWCVMHYELLEGAISFLTNECCFGLSTETLKTETITAEHAA